MSDRDPFDTLGVPPRFDIAPAELRARWMRAAAASHPDATGAGADASSAVNAAYHELADPLRRASALLRRLGAPAVPDPGLPPAFLLEAMELREQVDEVREDRDELGRIRDAVAARRQEAIDAIARGFAAVEGAPSADAARGILASMNLARALARVVEQIDQESGVRGGPR